MHANFITGYLHGLEKGRAEGGGAGGESDGVKTVSYVYGGSALESFHPTEDYTLVKISNETPTIAEASDGAVAVKMSMTINGGSVHVDPIIDGTRPIGIVETDGFDGWMIGNYIQCITQEAVDAGSSFAPSAGLWAPAYIRQIDENGDRIEHSCWVLFFTWKSSTPQTALTSADGNTLQDANGQNLIPKEDE